MHTTKITLFTASLGLASILCVLVFGFNPSPGRAGDELQEELVPGLDLWSERRKAAPYWGAKETTPDLLPRAERHREFMQAGVPLEYRSHRNPYPQAKMIIDDGGRLYKLHCGSCHGSKGSGGGEAGRDLTPPPAFLAYLIKRPRSVDEYLLWTISEGGTQFGSEMPTFKETLTEQQIWQIVTYMRADFPDVREAGQD
jgi:mono/diheme cytochrome c family protein